MAGTMAVYTCIDIMIIEIMRKHIRTQITIKTAADHESALFGFQKKCHYIDKNRDGPDRPTGDAGCLPAPALLDPARAVYGAGGCCRRKSDTSCSSSSDAPSPSPMVVVCCNCLSLCSVAAAYRSTSNGLPIDAREV
jgi:hypothetical protein